MFKAGSILTFTWGSYSDKNWDGPFRVLKDIDTKQILELFRKDFTSIGTWEPSTYDFIGWLNKKGYITDVEGDCHDWYLGNYDFEPEEVV